MLRVSSKFWSAVMNPRLFSTMSSASNRPSLSSEAMATVLSRTSTSPSPVRSADVAVTGPSFRRVRTLGPSPFSFRGMDFKLRMMSVTSSTTPGMVENSWSTPWIRTAVMAAPLIEDSRIRRKALPTVVPYPRSNGWAVNRPYVDVKVS